MVEFLSANWLMLLIIAVLAGAAFIAIRLGYSRQISQGLLYLVTKAEQEYGGGTGELKYAAVATWIYEKLPAFARIFISARLIDRLIEDAVAAMKKYLAENSSAGALIVKNGEAGE